ncbi:MAG: OmpA family protein [Deltaproteobacteria bacterium]|nr:OmpA family protein [Deltaproteobacteria bacterium]
MRRYPEEDRDNVDRWVVSYADFITLLFAFFTVMYGISRVDSAKLREFAGSARAAFGPASSAGGKPVIEGIVPVPREAIEMQKEAARIVEAAGMQGSLSVRREGRGIVLSMGENVLFDPGRSSVKTSSGAALSAVAAVLEKWRGDAAVEGHTDSLPVGGSVYASNWELSTARATNVLARLIEDHGIPAARLSAAGYAEFRPVVSNATPEGRARNRRVDVVLLLGNGAGGNR